MTGGSISPLPASPARTRLRTRDPLRDRNLSPLPLAMEALLGEKLLNKSEEVSTSVALKADVIGLYFSAHW